jgi:hypothetical protein
LSVCKRCHNTASGLLKVCPNCGHTDLDWFSRITGYYQNVSGWNAGKREELKRRYRVLNGSSVQTFDFSNASVQQGQLRSAKGVQSP